MFLARFLEPWKHLSGQPTLAWFMSAHAAPSVVGQSAGSLLSKKVG
jgi:hypothetical protein